ncbi:putative quinol monooxygenase [Maribacter sp. 2304DJ31-5]|uniref:putative quinol monooxygenase n=1 Tax=Maribacter sp. 2304DJ31-5 TaxID=3386273 RepID=UPI0039BC9EF2
MIHVFVSYKVRSRSIEATKTIIGQFIASITKNEPQTLLYKSFQEADDPTKFVHIMTFTDVTAEHLHKKSSYCHEFTDALYPLCEIMPKPVYQIEVD